MFWYSTSNETEKEIIALTKVIKKNPQDGSAYNKRANDYFLLRKYAKALRDYNSAENLAAAEADLYIKRNNASFKKN
jgi:tetratricopeptide (TPR) repeat protein